MTLFARIFGTRTSQELEARLLPILHMMMLDGEMHENEQVALAAHLAYLGVDASQFRHFMTQAQSATVPIPSDPRHKVEVLLGAAAIMVADGDIAVSELAFLHLLAARMQIPPSVLREIIAGAIKLGESINPGVDLKTDFKAAEAVLVLSLSASAASS